MSNASKREIPITAQHGVQGSFFHSEVLKRDYSNNIGFNILTYKLLFFFSLEIFLIMLYTSVVLSLFSSAFHIPHPSHAPHDRSVRPPAGTGTPPNSEPETQGSDSTKGHMAIRN